jgi:cell wall-associated NlpC family hydrolase
MALPSGGIPGKPGSKLANIVTYTNPVMAQIAKAQAAVEQVGEKLTEAGEKLVGLTTKRAEATMAVDTAAATLAEKQREADEWARDTYMEAATHPGGFGLGETIPGRGTLPGNRIVDTPLTELASAQHAYDEALKAQTTETDAESAQQLIVDSLRVDLDAKVAALAVLKTQNSSAVAAAEAARDQQNTAISAEFLKDSAGSAGTAAQQAVKYALAQLGKPYVWGAEGPNAFDCSGLVQAAYASAGVNLPRTARPQFRATTTVPISALVPGDLLFFATNKADWNTIHHVGIYLGKGKMVHAPTYNDVVKVAPIWWAEFFGATRVVPASNVPAPPVVIPKPTPKPTPAPTPKPTATPKPTQTPKPTPTPTHTPSPTPSPCPTPTPTHTPSPTPDPTPDPPASNTSTPSPPPSSGTAGAACN